MTKNIDSDDITNYNFSNKNDKKEVAHLVPCIIHYSGKVTDVPVSEGLQFDKEEMDKLNENSNTEIDDQQKENKKYVTYLRGRKIIGYDLLPLMKNCNAYLMEEKETIQGSNFENIAQFDKIINYEREGNDIKLNDEHERFKEFLALNNTIHCPE